MAGENSKVQSLGAFVWSIAQILRGDFKQSEYGKVVLPFVIMRRLDYILESSKDAVLAAAKSFTVGADDETCGTILIGTVGGCAKAYSPSKLTFENSIDFQQEPVKCHG